MFRFVAWPFALMNMAASFLGFAIRNGCGMSGLYTGLMSRASAKTPQISG